MKRIPKTHFAAPESTKSPTLQLQGNFRTLKAQGCRPLLNKLQQFYSCMKAGNEMFGLAQTRHPRLFTGFFNHPKTRIEQRKSGSAKHAHGPKSSCHKNIISLLLPSQSLVALLRYSRIITRAVAHHPVHPSACDAFP